MANGTRLCLKKNSIYTLCKSGSDGAGIHSLGVENSIKILLCQLILTITSWPFHPYYYNVSIYHHVNTSSVQCTNQNSIIYAMELFILFNSSTCYMSVDIINVHCRIQYIFVNIKSENQFSDLSLSLSI